MAGMELDPKECALVKDAARNEIQIMLDTPAIELISVLCVTDDGKLKATKPEMGSIDRVDFDYSGICGVGSEEIGSIHTHPNDRIPRPPMKDVDQGAKTDERISCIIAPDVALMKCYTVQTASKKETDYISDAIGTSREPRAWQIAENLPSCTIRLEYGRGKGEE